MKTMNGPDCILAMSVLSQQAKELTVNIDQYLYQGGKDHNKYKIEELQKQIAILQKEDNNALLEYETNKRKRAEIKMRIGELYIKNIYPHSPQYNQHNSSRITDYNSEFSIYE